MCGICGIVAHVAGGVDLQRLLKMRDVMIHRGPDGAGHYVDINSQVGLGHRRLNIIDLTDAASQPMTNEDGSIWITYNGEIYNYLELAPVLQGRGHRFMSHSDTEVIIHAYEEWGLSAYPASMACLRSHCGTNPHVGSSVRVTDWVSNRSTTLLEAPSSSLPPN